MTYQLGIDVGSTTVVAAVHRAEGPAAAEVVPLGGGGPTVPSALHLARDGGVTVGEGALRLAGIDPGRVVRALPRRIGDPAPVAVGGGTWPAEDLLARLVRWVVDRVAEREGGPATRITLAHPALWAVPTLERLAVALAAVDVHATFLPEPLAVAHAARADGEPGDTIAVYDLGGGRFDAAVVRRNAVGFGLLGRPEGLADFGGLDLDDQVWRHVRAGLPEGLVPDARVRRACLRAKETLSTKAEAVVRVRQGELRGEVRLDRGTFEGLVAAHVDRTVEVLRRAVASAGLAPEELTAVLLVGGSSRIPLVARVVSAQLGRAVAVLDDPGWVARGAALAVPTVTVDGAGSVPGRLPAPTRVPACESAAEVAPEVAPEAVTAGPDQGDPGRPALAAADSGLGSAPSPVNPSPVDPSPVVDAEQRPVAGPGVAGPAVAGPVVAGPVVPAPVVAGPVVAGPVVAGPVVARSVVVGSVVVGPVVAEATDPDPAATTPERAVAVAEPADPETVDPQSDGPGDADAEAAPSRRAVPVRTPAVLDAGTRRGPRSRSLPRLLVGAGAVAAAALVVVALFRPDGPLDPPLDPGVGAARVTGAPVVPAPLPAAPAGDILPGAALPGGLPVDGAPAAVRMTDPLRPDDPAEADRRVVDRPVERGAGDAAEVDGAPAPDVRMTGPGPAARGAAAHAEEPPVGAATRVPPTPAPPRV
jgi:molecular chaperone DnaK